MATYTRFSSDDVVITTEKVYTNTWTNGTNDLGTPTYDTMVYTSATSSGAFYANVSLSSEVQYSIAYGHKAGSGSLDYTTSDPGYSSARSIYGQYRSLVYGDENRNFTFNGYEPQDIYVININRARYKQALRLGSLALKLEDTTLTDDSVTRSGSAVLTNLGRQYNIVSGSNGVMEGTNLSQTNSGSYGLFYPDAGVIILNVDALYNKSIVNMGSLRAQNTSVEGTHTQIKTALTNGAKFVLDTQENISSQFYFVRAKNKEFNYSTNPSFIDANGNLNFTSMIDNPVSYITTVGLYNDSNELLAVAKLSQPIAKDFTKEALIKVKLDY